MAKLDALGFDWSPPTGSGGRSWRPQDEASWEAMRAKLGKRPPTITAFPCVFTAFQCLKRRPFVTAALEAKHGHCGVPVASGPTGGPVNQQLANWANAQREGKMRLEVRRHCLSLTFHCPVEAAAQTASRCSKHAFPAWPQPISPAPMLPPPPLQSPLIRTPIRPPSHPPPPDLHHSQSVGPHVQAGNPNPGLTEERVAKLDALGFSWAKV